MPSTFARILSELRRRRVFRVAAVYAVVGWLVIQIAETTFPYLTLPAWTVTLVIVLALLGFPIALVLAWAFDITPEGVRRTETLPTEADPSGPRRPLRAGQIAVAGAVLILGLAGGAFALFGGAGQRSPSDDAGPIQSLGVLPFADMSPERDQEYFSDGLSEELLDALARVEGLRVPARTSSFALKGQNLDVREIGRRLGVQAVLEGSVRKSGDRLRITAQLINAADGYRIWSESYDRQLSDVFAVQDEIARSIVGALQVRLAGGSRAPLVKERTANPEAYDLYLRGLHFLNRRSGESFLRAAELFRQALEIDPSYALAYAMLAEAQIELPTFGTLTPREAIARARTAATRALELDDSLAEAHIALGTVQYFEQDYRAAERSYRRAIELNPNSAAAEEKYSSLLVALGRRDEAFQRSHRARDLDPLAVTVKARLGLLHYWYRQYDQAIEQTSALIEVDPSYFYARWIRGLAYTQKGLYEEALAELRTARELSAGSPLVTATLGYAYARAGQRDEAAQILRQLRDPASQLYLRPQGTAFLLAALGRTDEAFRVLEAAVEEYAIHPHVLRIEPMLDPLRSDPRYERLLERAGLK